MGWLQGIEWLGRRNSQSTCWHQTGQQQQQQQQQQKQQLGWLGLSQRAVPACQPEPQPVAMAATTPARVRRSEPAPFDGRLTSITQCLCYLCSMPDGYQMLCRRQMRIKTSTRAAALGQPSLSLSLPLRTGGPFTRPARYLLLS
jgi:hypothetical protein